MKKLLLTLSLALIAILANAKSTVYLRVDGSTVTALGTWNVYYWGGATSTWPGSQMALITDNADDGYQYFSLEINTDETYNIIFTRYSGSWQTSDITGLKGDVAYSLNDKSYTKLDAVPTWTPDSEDGEDESTIYLQVDGTYTTSSTAPYLYAWTQDGNTKLLGEWPGTAMTLIDDVAVDGKQYYSLSVANGKAKFLAIFNQGSGKPQTDNIPGLNESSAFKLTGKSVNNLSYEKLSTLPVWLKITAAGESTPAWSNKAFGILSDKEKNAYKVQLSDDIIDLESGFVVEYNGTKFSTGGALSLGKWDELLESDTAMTIDSGSNEEIYLYVKVEDGTPMIKFLGTDETSGVDTVEASATIAANAGEIVVNGAKKVAVYTVGGALISTDARTKVARGLYIVRADNQVKKVVVK